MTVQADVVFRDRYGLHPRAAMRIQQAAAPFHARVSIEGTERGGRAMDARSMISLVSAGIRTGDRIRITADGADEAAVVEVLRALVEAGVCHP